MSKIKIAFVGDIMTGDLFYNMGSGVRSNIKKYGKDFIDREICNVFKEHDLVFGNLESITSDKGINKSSLRSMSMRGEPYMAEMLYSWGINIVSVANNHILEHGYEAAADTVQMLKNASIDVTGCGTDGIFNNEIGILKKTIGGINLYFISLCLVSDKYAYNGGGGINDLLKKIEEIKTTEHGVIIVSLHWGYEYVDQPTGEQINLTDLLFNAGANLIIGHHPHVYQGIQQQNDKLIAYSLGNFLFGGFYRDTDWSVILSVTIDDRIKLSYDLFPIISDREYRPCLAKGDRKRIIIAEALKREQLLKVESADSMKNLEDDIRNQTKLFRKNLKFQIIKNILTGRIKPVYISGIILRPIQRRLGFW